MISLKQLAGTIVFASAAFCSASHEAVFIAAHPDDIALMMNKNAANDVANG
jgi:hypothetical protein